MPGPPALVNVNHIRGGSRTYPSTALVGNWAEERSDRDYPSRSTMIRKADAGSAGWRSVYADTLGRSRRAPVEVKQPLALPFLRPLVAGMPSKCSYLLGSEATTPYRMDYQSTARASYSAPSSQTSPFRQRVSKLAADKEALASHVARWTQAPTAVTRERLRSTSSKLASANWRPSGTVLDAKYRPGHHGLWH